MKQLITFFLWLGSATTLWAQQRELVQVTGVVMTADSSQTIPYASIMVRNLNHGDIASNKGVFSLACYKGDTLDFTAMGFKEKTFVVPNTMEGKFLSMVQLLPYDTFFIDETVINSNLPQNADEFQYALRYYEIDQDMYYTALKNVNPNNYNSLMKTLPKSGAETQSTIQRTSAERAVYGQYQTSGQLGNPLKWAEFLRSVRNGDLKSKKTKK